MPNYVTTVCTVTGPAHAVEAFRAQHISGENKLDFNAIVPMPECIKGTESGTLASLGRLALYGAVKAPRLPVYFARLEPPAREQLTRECTQRGIPVSRESLLTWVREHRPEALVQGERTQKAFDETGYADWYDWSIAHWGTKWNATLTKEELCASGGYRFKFETAWAFPEPIFRKLEEMYPDLVFSCASFDEGWCFAGLGDFGNGAGNRYRAVAPTDAMYETVYGEKPDHKKESVDPTAD